MQDQEALKDEIYALSMRAKQHGHDDAAEVLLTLVAALNAQKDADMANLVRNKFLPRLREFYESQEALEAQALQHLH